MATYTFANGTTAQKELWREGPHRLLNLPFEKIPLTIKVEFKPTVSGQTAFASTTWTYDKLTATTLVRNDYPGFGTLDQGLIAEAAAWGLAYNAQKHANETSVHELGHAVFAAIPHEFRVKIAQLFGAKSDTLSELEKGTQWQNRVIEGIAETFKEAFLPSKYRVFPNRTNRKISYAQFPRFRRLIRQGLEAIKTEGQAPIEYDVKIPDTVTPPFPGGVGAFGARPFGKTIWQPNGGSGTGTGISPSFCASAPVLAVFGAKQEEEENENPEFKGWAWRGSDVASKYLSLMPAAIAKMRELNMKLKLRMEIRPTEWTDQFYPEREKFIDSEETYENEIKAYFWSRNEANGHRLPLAFAQRAYQEGTGLGYYFPPESVPFRDYSPDFAAHIAGIGNLQDIPLDETFPGNNGTFGFESPMSYRIRLEALYAGDKSKWYSETFHKELENWSISHLGDEFPQAAKWQLRAVWETENGEVIVSDPYSWEWEGNKVLRCVQEDRPGDERKSSNISYSEPSESFHYAWNIEWPLFEDIIHGEKNPLVFDIPAKAVKLRGFVAGIYREKKFVETKRVVKPPFEPGFPWWCQDPYAISWCDPAINHLAFEMPGTAGSLTGLISLPDPVLASEASVQGAHPHQRPVSGSIITGATS